MSKYVFFLIPLLVALLLGCASSHENTTIPEEYSNVVDLKPAPKSNEKVAVSKIYIDSAEVFWRDNEASLLILGTFPDGCTNIGSADYQTRDGTISLTLNAWRKSDQMCTQSLVSFSFIYQQIPEETLREAHTATINGTEFTLNQ